MVQVSCPVFVVTGGTAEQLALAEAATRRRIAFYGSTRDYRPVLEIHGWGDLQPALNGLARQGEWDAMSSLVGDEVLDAFAVRGSPAEVAATLRARYGGVADRVSFNIPYPADDAPQRILAALQDTPRSAG